MPVAVSYPGVYIDEQRSGDVSISGVATSIALFVGMTQRGPMRQPRRVLNRTAFETLFGADATLGETAHQVRQFFLNGGGEAYVMRIANGDRNAALAIENELGTPTLTLQARDAGLIGNTIRAVVDYDTSRPETSFNLTVYREESGPGGTLRAVDMERHADLVTDPASARFVETVLAAQSQLVEATVGGAAAGTGFMLGGLLGAGNSAANATADLFARIATAITNAIARAGAGATAGRFDISVDEKPFVTVALPATVAAVADIQGPINTALAPLGVAVTVDTPTLSTGPAFSVALRITSNAVNVPGSSVRVRRATTVDDIAAELQWSAEDGALEVGGAAPQRPMANGLVARLGTSASDLSTLSTLLHQTGNAVTGLILTDPSGPVLVSFGLPGTKRLWEDTGTPPIRSLAAGRASLDALAGAINTALAAALPARRWTARRIGYRLVLSYNLPGHDVGTAVTIANNGGGTYDIGAVGNYLNMDPLTRANVAVYRMGHVLSLGFSNGGPTGLDGNVPRLADYDAAYVIAHREIDLFNLLVLPRNFGPPGSTGQSDADRDVLWGPASAFCLQRRAVLLVDPHQTGWNSADAAAAGLPPLRNGIVKDHAAIFWPRLQVVDPATGQLLSIDPAGSVAGVCARIDGSRGVWKAPAGLEASLVNVRGVEWRMSNEDNGIINPLALNALRAFASGIVVWGSRTMDGFDNSGNTDYRYLPVRRTALFIEESLYRGLQFAVFEPNAEPLWAQIRLAAGAFMNGLFRQGAFAAQKSSDAYFVKCDEETTTVTDQALGQVNVLVGFAPLRPAEFIVVTVKQKAGQVQA